MQFVISKVDKGEYFVNHEPQLAISHGIHYFVKTYYESTRTVIVEGENGQDFRLLSGQYITEEEQRIKYNLAAMAAEREKQQKAS